MKKYILKLLVLTLCLVCALSVFSVAAYAIDPIQLDKDVSAKLEFKYGEMLIPNAEFSLYRVADTSVWAEFTASGDFKEYTGALNGMETASEWDAAAKLLSQYISEKHIQPLHKGKTNADGQVIFSGNMKPGLYLLTCSETTYKDKIYTALPCLVCLPNRLKDSDDWIYEESPLQVKAGDVRDVPTPPDIPHTGMLWWPVPALLVIGLAFVVIGVARRRSYQNEK